MATEIDPVAVACARNNGIEIFPGDLGASLPNSLRGRVDVVTAVVPYVPTSELAFLPRDVLRYEHLNALDGGADGTHLLVRACRESALLLHPGGSLLLELGGAQDRLLEPELLALGFDDLVRHLDEDGDLRCLVCLYQSPGSQDLYPGWPRRSQG